MKKFLSSQNTNRGRPARKFSLSPVRRADLPGSPEIIDFSNEQTLVGQTVPQKQIGEEAKKYTTVLSPIKKPYKNTA